MTNNKNNFNAETVLFSFISKYITLTEHEKLVLRELNLFRQYKKESVLFREGDFTNEAYMVIKGCIRTYYIIDGEEQTIEFYTEMDSYNPPSTIEKTASKLFASIEEESLLLVSTSTMEEDVFLKFPRFEMVCRKYSEEILARQQSTFEEFRTLDPEERYLHLMNTRPTLLQRVPQYKIASYLGIQPESLSRIRKRLAEK